MDKLRVHQKSPKHKQAKAKKKPVKIVYISNPMKVKTSASEFKGLVQELTGQDSDIADISKFSEIEPADELPVVSDPGSGLNDDDPGAVRPGHGGDADGDLCRNVATPFDMFDELFTPHMLESFSLYNDHQADTFRR